MSATMTMSSTPVIRSCLDRYLTLWSFLAMVAEVVLGGLVPGVKTAFGRMSLGTTSIPIVGLSVIYTQSSDTHSFYSRNTFRIKSVSLYSRPAAISSPSKRR